MAHARRQSNDTLDSVVQQRVRGERDRCANACTDLTPLLPPSPRTSYPVHIWQNEPSSAAPTPAPASEAVRLCPIAIWSPEPVHCAGHVPTIRDDTHTTQLRQRPSVRQSSVHAEPDGQVAATCSCRTASEPKRYGADEERSTWSCGERATESYMYIERARATESYMYLERARQRAICI